MITVRFNWRSYAIALLIVWNLVLTGTISHNWTAMADRIRFVECFVDLDPPEGEYCLYPEIP